MVEAGAGLVCASHSEVLAHRVAETFQRAGVVCEVSDDPVGAELAGVAKNAAAVAVGATQAQGLNAAGMAAADIFLEVLSLAEAGGGRPRTFVGRAGTGDLVATALAPTSRNRSAGELLAEGVPAAEIPERLGQAVEALETVRLLARAIERDGLEAPVTSALAHLIEGELPLDDWIELVRAKQPEPARFGPRDRVVAHARLVPAPPRALARAPLGPGHRGLDSNDDEAADPSRVRPGPRALHLRQRVQDPLHPGRDARGDLLELPPVLHGQAEAGGHRRPRRALPPPRRPQPLLTGLHNAAQLARPSLCSGRSMRFYATFVAAVLCATCVGAAVAPSRLSTAAAKRGGRARA